jgi:alpha-beta hydrolase superfamily lysophospholipase
MSCAADAGKSVDIRTPKDLWAGFDARKEPLEIQTVRRWQRDGCDLHAFYFNGETVDGEKALIYGLYGAPTGGKKLPAVLHIHGGGQPASLHWVLDWNKRGYAAMTFNWGGEWDNRSRYAIWGDRLRHCNHKYAGEKIAAVHPTPRESSWYHWTLVSRRALTVLERQKEVDPKRLGIFGISMGGTIVWNVAGTDDRVKAACAIYGVGWNTYPASKYEKDPKADDADTLIWRQTMEPEAYAPLMKSPVLLLNATNDQHGKFDWSYDTLDALKCDWRVAYTPQFRHHIAEEQGRNLPLWMDTHLRGGPAWPKTPAAEVSLGEDGVPVLTVRPDVSQEIKRVDLYYAVENPCPFNRHWRQVKARKKADAWTAALPVMDVRKHLFAFANVHYKRGMCLTSNLAAAIPAKLGEAKATDAPSMQIADFSEDLDGFLTTSTGTDPVVFYPGLARQKGPGDRYGIRPLMQGPSVITYKIGDPKWRGPDGAKLAFEAYCPEPVELQMTLHENEFDRGWERYRHVVKLEAGKAWRDISLTPGKFQTEKGKKLSSWRQADMIEMRLANWPEQRPIFTNFRWVRAGR